MGSRVSKTKKKQIADYNPFVNYLDVEIHKRTRNILCGFIRRNTSNLPEGIIKFILLYYYDDEYFDIYTEDIVLSPDRKTVLDKGSDDWHNTIYGKHSILSTEAKICKWYLKLGKSQMFYGVAPGSHPYKWIIDIGICSDFDLKMKCYTLEYGESTKFYSYHSKQCINSHQDPNKYIDYGERWYRPGDTICIELNLVEKIIKFHLNGQDQGVAFENVECGDDIYYKLAVTIYHKFTQLTIVKYDEIYQ